jgi:hypothetical protein
MNNTVEALTISKIDLSNLVFTKIRQVNNKKIILVKYGKNKSNFVFQTPSLDLVNKQDNSIEVSLSGKEKIKVNNFINFLSNLERKLKNEAQNYYAEWFDNNNETINFQKLIRESDQFKNGTLKFKLINTTDFKTEFNNLNNLSKDVWVKIILELYAVWIDNENNFGVYLRPVLVSFENKVKYNYKFADSDSDNEVDIPDTEMPLNNNIFINPSQHQTDVETLVSHLDLLSSISSLSKNSSDTSLVSSLGDSPRNK